MYSAIGRRRTASFIAHSRTRLRHVDTSGVLTSSSQWSRSCSRCTSADRSHNISTPKPLPSSSSLSQHAPNSTSVRADNKPYSTIVNTSTPPAAQTDDEINTKRLESELHFAKPVSPGSPFFQPGGTKIFNKLVNFLRAQYVLYGYDEVITPTIYKKSLWKQSGHWDNYKEAMFSVTGRGASGVKDGSLEIGQEEEYGLKPMNCPGHCLLFSKTVRSYRDLPIRFAEFAPLHRNEIASALTGLKRVRRFHQDDAHIFCRPSQVESEISSTLRFIDAVYGIFNIQSYKLVLSTRPMPFIGEIEAWDRAEAALKKSLDASGREWTLNEGDGAFYGPKIDVILKDSLGREQQTATIQLDFQLPIRFELEYMEQGADVPGTATVSKHASMGVPVMIHRAIFGSVERFMAMLMEHYNGYWPFWLNPHQAVVVSISPKDDGEEVVQFAKNLSQQLSGMPEDGRIIQSLGTRTFGVTFDKRPLSFSKKIKMAYADRYQYMIVIGAKETQTGQFDLVDLRNNDKTKRGLNANEIYQHFIEMESSFQ